MKSIRVVAAIIKDKDKILATKRSYGEFKGGWEFPGGKIEEGEDKKTALIREIKEELNANIKINSYFATIDYTYPNFHMIMDCYICNIDDFVINEEIVTVSILPPLNTQAIFLLIQFNFRRAATEIAPDVSTTNL